MKGIHLKGSLKCLETCSIVQCVEVISTETGRQGGTYQIAPPPLKKANSV